MEEKKVIGDIKFYYLLNLLNKINVVDRWIRICEINKNYLKRLRIELESLLLFASAIISSKELDYENVRKTYFNLKTKQERFNFLKNVFGALMEELRAKNVFFKEYEKISLDEKIKQLIE